MSDKEYPLLHPRHQIRGKASIEINSFFLEVIEKYDLSYGELFFILGEFITIWAKYLRRDEDKIKNNNK